MANPQWLQAKVKSCLSGDTIILQLPHRPDVERQLSLAFIDAPRLRREGDEPFAFASRDFLRRSLVGRVVQFRILYTIPSTKKEFGVIKLPDGPQLPELVVSEGWAKVREGRREESDDNVAILEALSRAESSAKSAGRGLWEADAPRLESSYELSDAKAFLDEHKDTEIKSIVEKALSGDRLIVRLMPSETRHIQTLVLVAGIRAPATKRTNPSDGKEQPAEPCGTEAQQFVESRLLQRNVLVIPLGVSPQGQLIASVNHPTHGPIAPFLLEDGLARCADQHSTMLGNKMGALRQAEQKAKSTGRGLFKGQTLPHRPAAGNGMEGQVSRVQSADTIFVRSKLGTEKRLNLSSVRAPKNADPQQSPWGPEAKEFLRKRLIGKHVSFKIDGKRPATEGYDEREMASLTHGGKNIALVLVESGYASVIRHRADDNDRSPIYDDLLQAEQQAQAEKKGMWSGKSPATKSYVDYSETAEKAKRELSILQRQKKVPAIVDFVKSGSRFTVLVPRDNARLTFVLSGIRAPRSARSANEKGEPFGQEAHDFAVKRCMQRDVEIDVDDNDKVGGFIGTLYVNRENFAKLLLEEGFASVHDYSAEKSGHAAELYAAERRAKEAHKGMWHDWSEPTEPTESNEHEDTTAGASNGAAASANGSSSGEKKLDYRDVVITHVDESARLRVQDIGSPSYEKLEEVLQQFRAFHATKAASQALSGAPKAGDFVAAKFSADGQWYRAKIRRNDREAKKAEVVYVDYGNSETIAWSDLRPLGKDSFGPQGVKPQAQEVALSFCQFPTTTPQYMSDAVGFLTAQLLDKHLVANRDVVDADGVWWVTLLEDGAENRKDSFNGVVIREGYAVVPRKLKAFEKADTVLLTVLKKEESAAKEEHLGVWEYGDLTEDE